MIVLWLAAGVLAGSSVAPPVTVDVGDGGKAREYHFVPELKRILASRNAERLEALETVRGDKGKKARYMVKIAAKEAEKAIYADSKESADRIARAFDNWLSVYAAAMPMIDNNAAFQTFLLQVAVRIQQDEEELLLLSAL